MTFAVGVLYQRSVHEITNQISNIAGNSLNFTIDYIESSLKSIMEISGLILNEERIAAAARIKAPVPEREIIYNYVAIRERLNNYIQRIRSPNSSFGFDSYYLYFPHQNLLMDSKTTFYENINQKNVDFLQHGYNDRVWFITRAIDYYTINNIENRFGYDKLLTFVDEKKEDGRTAAVLAANVRVDLLSDFYNKVQKGVPGIFMILDGGGNYIANSNIEPVDQGAYDSIVNSIKGTGKPNGNFPINVNGQKNFLVYSVSDYTKWTYIVLIPAIEILGQIYNIQKYFSFVILVMTLLILPISFLTAGSLYKPLKKLVYAMRNVENGDLRFRINDKRRDEYQKVYSGFNDMVEKLKNLIEDISSEKAMKKEAEINLLQAQINPHFLYNTLDSIYSIAVVYKVDEISKIVSALSKFFRTSLSGGKPDISLRDALNIVKNYLIIQNIRFNGKIEYEIHIPEEYMNMIVPKLLLQPIVENAIYHGIERKKGKGRLVISCSRKDAVFYIHVFDDGVGMTEERLEIIKKSIYNTGDAAGDSNSFALKTLNRQIVLKHGQGYGLSLESSRGTGTTVTVSVPLCIEKAKNV
jgi:two-component system sensor histidine kinase YesM